MTKYLKGGFSIEKLANELKNENSELYFAMLANKALGYLN